MRLTLLTTATLFAAVFAAVVRDPSTVGPLSPEKDPRTSLEESIRRMRLSIDRELVYLARVDEVKRSMNTDGMVARQVLPADEETESTFHGFADKINDGTGIFRPIRPGVDVPSVRQQIEEEVEPSSAPTDPTFTDPTVTEEPSDGEDGQDGEDGPVESEPPTIVGRPGGRPGTGRPGGRPGGRPSTGGGVTDGGDTDGGDTDGGDTDGGDTDGGDTDGGDTDGGDTDGGDTDGGDTDGGVTDGGDTDGEESPQETAAVDETDGPMAGSPVVPVPVATETEEPTVVDDSETPIPTPDTTDDGSTIIPGTVTPGSEPTESPEPTLLPPGAVGVDITPEPITDIDSTPLPTADDVVDDDDDVCFPAHATVQLDGGSTKKMSEVQLGDRVLVANGQFSEVFMFTHKMSSVRHSFVELVMTTGHRLALTKGHYLYVNGRLAAASTVREGDTLSLGNNVVTTVENVGSIISTGLYNPQTIHGDIVVNGVRASTYTLSVEPKTAHALLAPLRAVYDRIGFSLSAFDMGANYLASLVPSGSLVN